MKRLGVFAFTVLCFGLVSCIIEPVSLTISSVEWKASVDSQNVGTVYLTISGKAEADTVTIQTHGDGVIGEHALTLDSDGTFSETIAIAFTHEVTDRTAPTSSSTIVTAEKGSESISQPLESGELSWTAE